MGFLVRLLVFAISVYCFLLFARVVLGWLIAANIVNRGNSLVQTANSFLESVTEPALHPIRARLPAMGQFDFSPVVLFIVLLIVQRILLMLA